MSKKQAHLVIALIVILFSTFILVDTCLIMQERRDLERFREEFEKTFPDRKFEDEFEQRYEDQRGDGVGIYGGADRTVHSRHGVDWW